MRRELPDRPSAPVILIGTLNMRQGRLTCAAAALIAMSGAAQAQGVAAHTIDLRASVQNYCTIDGGAASLSRVVTLTISDGKLASPRGSASSSSSSKVICTANAKIQLTTARGGLTNGPTPADPQSIHKIHYTARATYAGTTETLTTTDATPAGFQTAGNVAAAGAQTNANLDISIDVAATPAGKFLVDGTYTDIITVTLTPAI